MDVSVSGAGAINYEDRLLMIEQQELESQQGHLPPEIYCEFIALYLLQGDLNNCKLLWKRIPTEVKADCAELASLWEIGKCLLKRDLSGVFQKCNGHAWSGVTQNIVDDLKCKHKEKCIDLICKTYSTITAESAASILGCSVDECLTLSAQLGWEIEQDRKTLRPTKQQRKANVSIDNESHLQKLTQYISFLET